MSDGDALTPRRVLGLIVGFCGIVLLHLPIATVSLYSYVNPLIAVLLGTAILKEAFSARTIVAASVVLAGIVIVRGGRQYEIIQLDAR